MQPISAYEEHVQSLRAAQNRLDEAKRAESEARREECAAVNALHEAEKAFAEFLATEHPSLVDVIAERRRYAPRRMERAVS
jgi:glutathione S-transferase